MGDVEESVANAIMAFRDEQGREWLAGAFIGNLARFEGGQQVETIEIEDLKDRSFGLTGFKLVRKS